MNYSAIHWTEHYCTLLYLNGQPTHQLQPFLSSTTATYEGLCWRLSQGLWKLHTLFFSFKWCFSCIYLRIKITSVVVWPGMNPNCMLSISSCCLISTWTMHSRTFIVCSSNFKGCFCYIFTSFFCLHKREDLWNKGKHFLFHFERSFDSWDNVMTSSKA